MNERTAPASLESLSTGRDLAAPRHRLSALAMGVMLSALVAGPALAGGADVSTDEIYSDGVTLLGEDGAPLDINGDGHTDLAVAANRGGATERSRYYLGNGDGTFSAGVLLTGGASSEIAAADMNGDAFLDLVQGRRDATDKLHAGDGAGGVTVGVSDISADALRVLDLAIGDLDGDGDLDIVTGNGREDGTIANPAQANRFYLNDGLGNFVAADISADADDTRSIELADMDGDGDLDVIAGNDETTPGSNRVYLNQFVESGSLTVSFAAGVDFGPADDQTSKVLVGDLDGDGLPDLVVLNHVKSPESPGTNRFYLNETNGGPFALSTATDVSAATDNTGGGVLADFDGDGDLDLAVANLLSSGAGESSRSKLYLNQFVENGSSTVSFAAGTDISTDEQQSRSMAAADINGDGKVDIVVGNQDDVTGVPGHDRRYLNNGTADPFTNVTPVIDIQAGTLETDEETDLTIEVADVDVTDPDNVFPDDFTLTVQSGSNYTVTDNTITPAAGFDGDLTVPVTVSDGTDESATFNLTVTVNDTANTAPSFTSTPVVDATEGVAYSYSVTATDPDVSDTALTITAAMLPAWLSLDDNGDGSASLTGTPGAGDVGANEVSLEVSDGVDSTFQDFTITVAAAGGGVNNAPAFTSTAVTDAVEGVAYEYDVVTSDADGDTLEITAAAALPDWLTLTDNGDGTATLSGTPDPGDAGDHNVSLQVSDGTDAATQDFTISVAPAGSNSAPTFTSTPVADAVEGVAYEYDVVTSDADDDTLEITAAAALPDWLTLTDNGDGTATLSGTPGAGDAGDHDVSLQVSDGTDAAVQDFTISVAPAGSNSAPTFTSTPVVDATEGTTYTYDVTAGDADASDALEIAAVTLPSWLMLSDNGDGTATLTGTAGADDVGDHDVSLEVSDGTDTDVQDFTITVVAMAGPPPTFPPPSFGGGGSFGFFSVLALLGYGLIARRRRLPQL